MITALCLAAFLAASVVPQTPSRGVVVAGGGSCTTEQKNVTGADDFTWNWGGSAGFTWIAQKFQAPNTATLCAIDLRGLTKVGTPTHSVTVAIYTHNAGADTPDTAIDTSDAVSSAGVAGGNLSFTAGLSAGVTASTTYWLVGRYLTIDGSNYTTWMEINGSPGLGGNSIMASANGTAWTDQYDNGQLQFILYSN